MAKSITPINSEKIERISYLAREGKTQAVRTRYTNELNRIYSQYQSAANSRLRNLKNRYFDYGSAWEQAQGYIRRTDVAEAYTYHKPITIQAMERQLYSITAFLRDPTSLVSYQKKQYDKGVTAMMVSDIIRRDKLGYEGMRGSDEQIRVKKFFEFINDSEISKLITAFLDTKGMIEKLHSAWDTDPQRLKKIIDRFSKGQANIEGGISAEEAVDLLEDIYESEELRGRI